MNFQEIAFRQGTATQSDVLKHLTSCDENFEPALHTYANLSEYSAKIAERAVTIEAWEGNNLGGLLAVYLNDPQRQDGFVTNVSVLKELGGRGIASRLLSEALCRAKNEGFKRLKLEVRRSNALAIRLYLRQGFLPESSGEGTDGAKMTMIHYLESEAHDRIASHTGDPDA